jgi:hypothetical protein
MVGKERRACNLHSRDRLCYTNSRRLLNCRPLRELQSDYIRQKFLFIDSWVLNGVDYLSNGQKDYSRNQKGVGWWLHVTQCLSKNVDRSAAVATFRYRGTGLPHAKNEEYSVFQAIVVGRGKQALDLCTPQFFRIDSFGHGAGQRKTWRDCERSRQMYCICSLSWITLFGLGLTAFIHSFIRRCV